MGMGLDGISNEAWASATPEERLFWHRSYMDKRKEQDDAEWKAVDRYNTRGRGAPPEFWRENLHDEGLIREKLETEAKKKQEHVLGCEDAQELLEMLQKSIEIRNVYIPNLHGYWHDSYDGVSTLDIYITNEFVLPILHKLEALITTKPKEDIKKLAGTCK